ncbi:MAG: serine/threonine-protein phosphatase [Phycisphaerales bacterium]|nr:serine/threonine-protein phosphatase [Phycisphaerales bacterium]
MRCSEVWGGTHDIDLDVRTSALSSSIWSAACDGTRGGDVYYFSVCDHDMLTRLAIADVVGHGASVNEVGDWLYDSMVHCLNDGDDAAVLTELNRMACSHQLEMLGTAAVYSYVRGRHLLHFCSAGHPPALLYRQDARAWRALEPATGPGLAGLPLAVMPSVAYRRSTVAVTPGDRLLILTDGLTESADGFGRQLGMERLLETLQGLGNVPLRDLKMAVRAIRASHMGSAPARDDVTLAVLEFH